MNHVDINLVDINLGCLIKENYKEVSWRRFERLLVFYVQKKYDVLEKRKDMRTLVLTHIIYMYI